MLAREVDRQQRSRFVRLCLFVGASVFVWTPLVVFLPATLTSVCLEGGAFATFVLGGLALRVSRVLNKGFATFLGAWCGALLAASMALAAVALISAPIPTPVDSLTEPWVCRTMDSCGPLILVEAFTIPLRVLGHLMGFFSIVVRVYAATLVLPLSAASAVAFIIGVAQLVGGLREHRRGRPQN